MTKKKLDKESESENSVGEHAPQGFITVPEMRLLSLYGEVEEKKAGDIVCSMFVYKNIKKLIPIGNENPPVAFVETIEPLDFLISTPGGSAADMFSIYDTMKLVQKDMEIHTLGVGKVMSAGVLLLAARHKR